MPWRINLAHSENWIPMNWVQQLNYHPKWLVPGCKQFCDGHYPEKYHIRRPLDVRVARGPDLSRKGNMHLRLRSDSSPWVVHFGLGTGRTASRQANLTTWTCMPKGDYRKFGISSISQIMADLNKVFKVQEMNNCTDLNRWYVSPHMNRLTTIVR